ncbi:hypothetical protein AB0M43_18840 [Longispora sp. NPDC051575]|uniref:hypothetical protein n=1 Tax=Longispora sp. NPDC051575 TaxID=3154943 RepID=UPI003424A8A8
MTDLPPVSTDPAATRPELAALRAAVRSHDWPAVSAFLGGLDDPDDHSFVVRFVGEIGGSEDFLRTVVGQAPGATLPMTLLAARLIELGWEARSGYGAEHVSQVQFRAFHEYLRQAERLLIEVTAREPADTSAWTMRLLTTRGLELGQSEARRRYDHAARHAPHSFGTQAQILQQLCPKWGGTWEDAHAFARECALAAPEGSLSGALVATWHLERWLSMDRAEANRYIVQAHVRAEVAEAAARSVDHPAFRRAGYRAAYALNTFAMATALHGDQTAAARYFHMIGAEATALPWSYHGNDNVTSFLWFRKNARAKG